MNRGARAFSGLSHRRDSEIDLARAALVFAGEECPRLDVGSYLSWIDSVAGQIGRGTQGERDDAPSVIARLNEHLFGRLGFRGNEGDYYDPRNSYLNEVIERRTGIPITLSLLYVEVGRRLGLNLLGVPFPGHFLVKHIGGAEEIIIDPFHRGRILSEKGCRDMLSAMFGGRIGFSRDLLKPATNRQILTRMLYNLKGIYLSRGEYGRALFVVDNLILLNPESGGEIRDRGVIYYQLECFAEALRDFEAYLDRAPEGEAADAVRSYVPALRDLVSKIN